MHGYLRDDGLIDIEGHLVDRKSRDILIEAGQPVPARAAVHEMWLRLTIDDDMLVHGAVAATDASPYPVCRTAPPSVEQVVGLRIGGGWSRAIKERLGGTRSCTHLMEMLIPMGTAAFQTLYPSLKNVGIKLDQSGRPVLIDSCLAMSSSGGVVAMRWPDHYTGPKAQGPASLFGPV